MKKIFKTGLLLLIPTLLSSQNFQQGSGNGQMSAEKIGKVSGKVIDYDSRQALEFANVVLYRSRDSVVAEGGITDEAGLFSFSKLSFGRYYLMIQFVGYPSFTKDSIFIRPNKPDLDLGNVVLKLSSRDLVGVEIKDTKAVMEYSLEKKVINVESNLATSGGTAVDIMQTIPAVQVDIDGNVSLRGSGNVTILVDGRPSGIVSLDELPASMIERVEIITNPSARYDPDGTSGIINIVLKKKKKPGYNGLVSINSGLGNRYSASTSLNYRYNKFNVFANYDYRHFTMEGYSNNFRESTFGDSLTFLDQKGTWDRNGKFHNVRFGADYFINPKNTLSFSGLLNFRDFKNSDFTNYANLSLSKDTTSFFTSSTNNVSKNSGQEFSMNYKKTFDNKVQELTADVLFSSTGGNYDSYMVRDFLMADTSLSVFLNQLQNTLSDNTRKFVSAQTDYVHPLGSGRLETGYKFYWQRNDLDYRMMNFVGNVWVQDSSRSNEFIYNEYIHSAYGIYSNSLTEKIRYQIGLRAEAAQSESNQVTQADVYKNDYFSLFPSVHIKYEMNDKHSAQISYSRRVNRPGSMVLNPFVNYSDPLNLSAGNPYLKPEYINAAELAYSAQIKNTTINASVFYRNIEGVISRIMTLDTSGVSFTTYKNQDKSYAYGSEIILTQQIQKWWRLNTSFSYFLTGFKGADVNTNTQESDSWTFKIFSMMTIPKIVDIQLNFNYNAPVVFTPSINSFRSMMMGGTQGRLESNYWADIGLKKDVLKGKGTITMRLSDVFKTQSFNITTYGSNFTTYSEKGRNSRILFIGFSYRFNDFKRRQNKDRENGMEDMEG
jgi:outer membrane receptor protein involved in Fe transport